MTNTPCTTAGVQVPNIGENYIFMEIIYKNSLKSSDLEMY